MGRWRCASVIGGGRVLLCLSRGRTDVPLAKYSAGGRSNGAGSIGLVRPSRCPAARMGDLRGRASLCWPPTRRAPSGARLWAVGRPPCVGRSDEGARRRPGLAPAPLVGSMGGTAPTAAPPPAGCSPLACPLSLTCRSHLVLDHEDHEVLDKFSVSRLRRARGGRGRAVPSTVHGAPLVRRAAACRRRRRRRAFPLASGQAAPCVTPAGLIRKLAVKLRALQRSA